MPTAFPANRLARKLLSGVVAACTIANGLAMCLAFYSNRVIDGVVCLCNWFSSTDLKFTDRKDNILLILASFFVCVSQSHLIISFFVCNRSPCISIPFTIGKSVCIFLASTSRYVSARVCVCVYVLFKRWMICRLQWNNSFALANRRGINYTLFIIIKHAFMHTKPKQIYSWMIGGGDSFY